MNIVVWLADGTWEAAVDAARDLTPAGADITLLHVTDPAQLTDLPDVWAGRVRSLARATRERGWTGTLRWQSTARRAPGPTTTGVATTATAERDLLTAAADRLGRSAEFATLRGPVAREVAAATAGADLLVVVRDGDPDRTGPRSLGPHTRYVVDHASCPVLLVRRT